MPAKEKAKKETRRPKIGIGKKETIVPAESEETAGEAGATPPDTGETTGEAGAIPRQLNREELEALRSKLQKKFH